MCMSSRDSAQGKAPDALNTSAHSLQSARLMKVGYTPRVVVSSASRPTTFCWPPALLAPSASAWACTRVSRSAWQHISTEGARAQAGEARGEGHASRLKKAARV